MADEKDKDSSNKARGSSAPSRFKGLHLVPRGTKSTQVPLQPPPDPSVPVWRIDVDTMRYIDANDAAVKMFGYPREELLQKTIFDIIAPEHQAALKQHLTHRRDTGEVGEWICRRKDGSRFGFKVRYQDEEVSGSTISFRYASEVREISGPEKS
jgi:PAS domain S-box-containing protein